jgi:hypothetical protein
MSRTRTLANLLALPLALGLPLGLAACNVGDPNAGTGTDAGPSGSDGAPAIDAPPAGTTVSGHITAPATWAGTVEISGAATIDPGVTVTVSPGATIRAASAGSLAIAGTLLVNGAKGTEVHLGPDTAGASWGGISIPSTGALTMTYGVIQGGGVHLSGGAATITDSTMWGASGDFLTSNGGTITVTYSTLGVAPGQPDGSHCQLHFDGTNTLEIHHNNIHNVTVGGFAAAGASYGLMLYSGTTGNNFKHNNWLGGGTDVEPTGAAVTGDFSEGWFEKGQPAGTPGLSYATPATAAWTDCGPR